MDTNDDMIVGLPEMSEEDVQMDFELRCAMQQLKEMPDVDREFERFKAERIEPTKSYSIYIIRYAAAAVVAVCIVAFFFLFHEDKGALAQKDGDIHQNVSGTVVYRSPSPMSSIALSVGDVPISIDSRDARKQGVSVGNDGTIAFLSPDNVAPENRNTISIPQGQVARLVLPDGTRVCLAARSRLIFPQHFLPNQPREVRLIGEGFFEVARDESRPFIVHSGSISTRVLGTVFNVRCFEGEQSCVTLVSGSVEVFRDAKNEQSGVCAAECLVPGQRAIFDDSKSSFSVTEADVEEAVSWKDGLFCFEDKTLRVVLTEVARWYNMNVVFANDDHMNDHIHYNGERAWNVQKVVDQLNSICNTNIKVEGDNLMVI